jgi:hypothetical protein
LLHEFIYQKICCQIFYTASFVLARPTDKTTVEYFIHIGRVLSGGTINPDHGDDEYVDKGELLDLIMNTLDMTEAELTANTGKSTLPTARQVIGAKYPGENVIYADVEKEHINAVVG